MKIIDCFPFFNEEEHLIFRIKLLQNYVDKFVICEADRTHSGIKKEFKCAEILKKHNLLSDKILIVYVQPENLDNWGRERAQRNAAAQLIQDDEVWFISDCDEIIDPFYLKTLTQAAIDNPDYIIRAPLIFNSTRADLYVCHPNGNRIKWDIPFFCLKKHIEKYTLSDIREAETLQKEISFKSLIVSDDTVGWHLSWMGNSNRRIQKLESFMHANDVVSNGVGLLSTNEAKEYVRNFNPEENKNDVLGRTDHILKPYPIEKLPQLILNDSKLKEFFLPSKHIHHESQFGEEWFTYPILYKNMVNKFPTNSRFVEVGSWKGKSTAFMCAEIAHSGKDIEFFCIDTWTGSIEHQGYKDLDKLYFTFLDNMRPLEHLYFPLKITSKEASRKFKDESLDFVFIDASHEYEDVLEDIKLWYPKVKKEGILAGHDCYPNNPEWGGVYRAVKETFTNITFTDENCFIVKK